jgi:hypothetical protein
MNLTSVEGTDIPRNRKSGDGDGMRNGAGGGI